MSRFRALFPGDHPIIGMIALPPMPGYPAFTSIDAIVDAVEDSIPGIAVRREGKGRGPWGLLDFGDFVGVSGRISRWAQCRTRRS